MPTTTPELKISSSHFGIRKDFMTETVRNPYQTSERYPFWINGEQSTERQLARAQKLLAGVMKRDSTVHDGVPRPASHVARKFEKQDHPTIYHRCESIPRFSFLHKDFLTFGTFDVYLRPGWDESLLLSAEEKDATERRKRVQAMKDKLIELNAITTTVKDVLSAYSEDNMHFLKDNMSFSVPVYLNNHEIHAWRTVSNLLFTYGESFNLSHMEELAAMCGLTDNNNSNVNSNSKATTTTTATTATTATATANIDMSSFRERHPEVFHFVCYCNLLLGGTKSFVSAKYMLLRDFVMLLKFLQQVKCVPCAV
jgi:hypothetical protein